LITLENISKTYSAAGGTVEALKNVSLEIGQGEFFALAGASGSGKTTLMNILGCLDRPDSGRYLFRGRDVSKLSSAGLASIRRAHIGFVFQTFNLLSRLSALENVELPLVYNGVPPSVRRELARRALRLVGLEDRAAHRPCQLSGGQQQRLCIARALAVQPSVILMDEPAASLDPIATLKIEELIHDLSENYTIVIVTHNMQQAGRVSDYTAFFYTDESRTGRLVEFDETKTIFTNPHDKRTEDYITGRFG